MNANGPPKITLKPVKGCQGWVWTYSWTVQEINPEHVEDDAVLSEKWPVSNTWSVDCWDVVSQPTLADWHRLGLLTVNVEAPHFENVQVCRWFFRVTL